jgi:hypothetical protein
MLDAQRSAKRLAAAFYELTLAKGMMDCSTNPLERFKAAERRVIVLARIFLPLCDDAEFKSAYAREMAVLRRQGALGDKNTKSGLRCDPWRSGACQ